MRIVYLLVISLLLGSCGSNQKTAQTYKTEVLNFNCPDNGDCVFKVLKIYKLKY